MSIAAGAAALFGLFIVAVGALGAGSPPRLIAFVRRLQSQTGLYAIAAIRVVFGLALWFAAPDSRAPGLLLILGAFTVLVGVATPFFGVRLFAAVLDWWSQRPSALLRTWCAVVVVLGLAIVWSLLPGSGTG